MITFLIKYWKPLLLLGLIAVYTLLVYRFAANTTANHHIRIAAELNAKLNQARIDSMQETADNAMTTALLAEERNRASEVVIREVTRWRTQYAKNTDNGKCAIPDEFVRLHDAAATGRLSEAPSGVSGRPSGITDIEVLAVNTDNYALCRKWRDQLIYIKNLYGK